MTTSSALDPRPAENCGKECDLLLRFLRSHNRTLVITGAGVSTASGIPDYRDANGDWKHSQPMQYREFIASEVARKRYWARSALGRERFKAARPNSAHIALTQLEASGKVCGVITQNVDGLHQAAGSTKVIDLHGRLDDVICLTCHNQISRDQIQSYLMMHNHFLGRVAANVLPDGDTELERADFNQMQIPDCHDCGGILKPNVVFYGENVPRQRVQLAYQAVDNADAVLVVGSSLMVYSGYRFVRHAVEKSKTVAAINRGVTRADDLLSLKLDGDCAVLLDELVKNVSRLSMSSHQSGGNLYEN